MKYKVIGWTDYENCELESESPSWAAIHAIMDEIKEKGFIITGYDHQESYNCVPVLNDGIKRTMSQRGWGRLMADVLGYRGMYDYSLFTYNPKADKSKLPGKEDEYIGAGHVHHYTAEEMDDMLKNIDELLAKLDAEFEERKKAGETFPETSPEDDFDEEYCEYVEEGEDAPAYEISEKSELNEDITVRLDVEAADRALEEGKIVLPELPELWMIDEGDRLILDTDGGKYTFLVRDVERERDFTPEEEALINEARYSTDTDMKMKAKALFETKPDRVIIRLRPIESEE